MADEGSNDVQTTLELKRGEQLTVATFRCRAGAEAKKQEYFDALRPVVSGYGYAGRGSLNVVGSSGEFLPEFLGFSSFATLEQARQFEADPRWPPIKAKRPEIWSDLRISKYNLSDPLTLRFRKNKIYELRYEWFADASLVPLPEGGSGVLAATFAAGIHEMLPSDLESPSRILLIEWSDLDLAKASGPSGKTHRRVDSIYSRA